MQNIDQAIQASIVNGSSTVTNELVAIMGEEHVKSTISFFRKLVKYTKQVFKDAEAKKKYQEVVDDPLMMVNPQVYDVVVGGYITQQVNDAMADLLTEEYIDLLVDIHVNDNLTITADVSYNNFVYSVSNGSEVTPYLIGNPRRDLSMLVVMVECSGSGIMLPSHIISDIYGEECLSLFRSGEMDWIAEQYSNGGWADVLNEDDPENIEISEDFTELFTSHFTNDSCDDELLQAIMKGSIELAKFYTSSSKLLYEERMLKRGEKYYQQTGCYYKQRHELIRRICPKPLRRTFIPAMKMGAILGGVVAFCDAYDFTFDKDDINEGMESTYYNANDNDLTVSGSIHIGLRSILNPNALKMQIAFLRRRIEKSIRYYQTFKNFYDEASVCH